MKTTSYKAEMLVDGAWYSNALRFATKAEAQAYGLGLFMRWTVPTDWRAIGCDDPVTHAADDSGIVRSVDGSEAGIRRDE